jgi:cell division protein FtsW (lipid II flippase)
MALLNARAYGQDVFAIDSLFVRMVSWVTIGTIVYLVTIRINWQWVRSFAWPLYAANILLLVVTLIYGVDSGGNARAIAIFGLTIQSSEISKVIALIALAAVLTRIGHEHGGLGDVVIACAVIGPLFVLVAAQPDLGTALVLV